MRREVMTALLVWVMPLSVAPAGESQCHPVVESRADQGWFRVRPHEDAFTHCTLTRVRLASLLQAFLGSPEAGAADFQSLFLGRLVDHPWFSRYLAERALDDPNWDAVRGLPRDGEINAFVRAILNSADAIALLQPLFAGTGYSVTGVSVEKVLVMPAAGIEWLESPRTELVPFDALTHLILVKDRDQPYPHPSMD